MIPKETIEQIREATDIVQIVGEYLRLKKKGRDQWACCPFHSEKSPSFKVSNDRQLFHCFGCGKGGNVYTFLMEHEKMTFVEAVRHLAAKANIAIRETGSDYRRDARERLNYAHEAAVEYYCQLLHDKRYAVVLDDYLTKKRGITTESIELFKLGLSGESWDGFISYARKKDLKPEELLEAGLVGRSEARGTYYDRFRQRLMIPIFNLTGKAIAFGGRTLKKGEPAKYVNSPETPLYSKSNVLYGLNLARDQIRQTGCAFIVEGYFDVISLFQVGIKNVVASSGTAFTSQQARLLARFAETVYLFFDADSAGRQAALRSVDALYDAGIEVKVIEAPAGEDPDSIAREHGSGMIEELRLAAMPFIDFRIKQCDLDKAGIITREKLIKELAALAGRIADPTRRELFLQDSADRLGTSQAIVQAAAPQRVPATNNVAQAGKRFDRLEFEMLSLLLLTPGAIDRAFETISPEDFDSKQLSRLYAAMVTHYHQTDSLNTHALIDNIQDRELSSVLSELASFDWQADCLDAETVKIIDAFLARREKRTRVRLKEELAHAQAVGDQKRADELIAEMKRHGLV